MGGGILNQNENTNRKINTIGIFNKNIRAEYETISCPLKIITRNLNVT
jgi:hypothetical protein